MVNKAVFLDRDGVINLSKVINGKPIAPISITEFRLYPAIKKLLYELIKKKFKLIVVTNQPDISIGKIKIEELNKMHERIYQELPITDIFVCPHNKKENCNCRKPRPGMLKKAIKKYKISVKKSFIIGDRKSDINAGLNLNLKTIYIDRDYKEEKPNKFDFITKSTKKALEIIIHHDKKN